MQINYAKPIRDVRQESAIAFPLTTDWHLELPRTSMFLFLSYVVHTDEQKNTNKHHLYHQKVSIQTSNLHIKRRLRNTGRYPGRANGGRESQPTHLDKCLQTMPQPIRSFIWSPSSSEGGPHDSIGHPEYLCRGHSLQPQIRPGFNVPRFRASRKARTVHRKARTVHSKIDDTFSHETLSKLLESLPFPAYISIASKNLYGLLGRRYSSLKTKSKWRSSMPSISAGSPTRETMAMTGSTFTQSPLAIHVEHTHQYTNSQKNR